MSDTDKFEFIGWYTDPEGGEKVSDSSKVSGNTVLYAHWQKIETEQQGGNTEGGNTEGGGQQGGSTEEGNTEGGGTGEGDSQNSGQQGDNIEGDEQ